MTITPMLARLARGLPLGDYLYEPKWDGFRCLAFREGGDVDLRSRNGRPLGRYFPETVEALQDLPLERLGLDGELVVAGEEELDLLALMARQHPAVKVKRERTVDCVVAGFRWLVERPLPSTLLLGLYDDGELRHVGVVGGFAQSQRRELLEVLAPLVIPLAGHPWEDGFLLEGGATGRFKGSAGRWAPGMEMDWVPVAPELVVEATYDQLDDFRFRHPARFVRWRPDRDPASCSLAQLDAPSAGLAELLP